MSDSRNEFVFLCIRFYLEMVIDFSKSKHTDNFDLQIRGTILIK